MQGVRGRSNEPHVGKSKRRKMWEDREEDWYWNMHKKEKSVRHVSNGSNYCPNAFTMINVIVKARACHQFKHTFSYQPGGKFEIHSTSYLGMLRTWYHRINRIKKKSPEGWLLLQAKEVNLHTKNKLPAHSKMLVYFLATNHTALMIFGGLALLEIWVK